MSFKKPGPSDQPQRKGWGRRIRKRHTGIRIFDTEARSLEEACDIIADAQRDKKSGDTRSVQQRTQRTLAQKLAVSKGSAYLLKAKGLISLAGGHNKPHPYFDPATKVKPPHPFRDLPPDQKAAKAKEMYDSGQWGLHKRACYKLSLLFGVTKGQIAEWVK